MAVYKTGDITNSSNAPLSASLFYKIQKDILSGKLKSGSKLTEQKICDIYKVSRTPVREALRQLEREGLVENIPNRGAFVLEITSRDIADMFALRSLYEQQACRWAVERMSDDDFETLKELFEFMEFYTSRKDISKMIDINSNFHLAIYNITGNSTLIRTLTSYQLYLKYTGADIYSEDDLDIILEEHRKIFNAIKKRDGNLASDEMKVHMENGLKRYLEVNM